MVNFTVLENTTLLILVSYMRVNSRKIIWMAKASWFGLISQNTKVNLSKEKLKVKVKKIFRTETDLSEIGKTMSCTEVASGTISKIKPKGKVNGKMEKE